MSNHHAFRQLGPDDLPAMGALLRVFGEVLDEPDTCTGRPPTAACLRGLLAGDTFIAIVAEAGGEAGGAVVGGIAAYELKKFEQERSEIHLYDLAVLEAHRRRGVATGLIRELQRVAATRGAWVIFVQADAGPEDEAAIALYTRLGTREEALHFDSPVATSGSVAGARSSPPSWPGTWSTPWSPPSSRSCRGAACPSFRPRPCAAG